MWLLLTLAVSAAGGFLLLRLKVPGGMLVGAILGAAILNVWTDKAFIYSEAKIFAQAMTGAYIGCMVTKEDIKQIPKLIKPFLVMLGCLFTLNVLMGFLFFWITDIDLLTCLLASAPSGISDTPLIAMDMGADSAVVAAMQFVRAIFGMGCLPTIILLVGKRIEPEVDYEIITRTNSNCGGTDRNIKKTKPTLLGFLPVFLLAVVACYCGKKVGIPGGGIACAFIAVAVLNISGRCQGMPKQLRRVAQVISGCCIGTVMTKTQMLQMGQLLIPAVILCVGYMICSIFGGVMLSKLFKISKREAMLTLSPAGATEMALIAADLGVESPNLIVLQIGRLISALLVFPHLYTIIVRIVSACITI